MLSRHGIPRYGRSSLGLAQSTVSRLRGRSAGRPAGTRPQGRSCGSIDTVRSPLLISLGYEGRTVSDVVEDLQRQAVTILVDVRLTPLSRKPGLSKRKLAAALAEAGIEYLHLPALGNPKDNRAPFRSGDPASRRRFRALMRDESALRAVDHIAELLDGSAVAVLCFERRHEQCHRHLVAEAVLEARPATELVAI